MRRDRGRGRSTIADGLAEAERGRRARRARRSRPRRSCARRARAPRRSSRGARSAPPSASRSRRSQAKAEGERMIAAAKAQIEQEVSRAQASAARAGRGARRRRRGEDPAPRSRCPGARRDARPAEGAALGHGRAATVARPYAEAAFELARERNALPASSEALRARGASAPTSACAALLGNPHVSAAQKKELFLPICGGKLDDEVPQPRRRAGRQPPRSCCGEIEEQFEELKREHERVRERAHHQRAAARPTRSAPTSRGAREPLRQEGRSRAGVDPELLGGARVQVGDQVIHALRA